MIDEDIAPDFEAILEDAESNNLQQDPEYFIDPYDLRRFEDWSERGGRVIGSENLPRRDYTSY